MQFMNFFKMGGAPAAPPKLQDVIKSTIEEAINPGVAKLEKNSIGAILSFTNTLDDSGELMLAISEFLDKNCEDALFVYKCLKLIYICLSKQPETFLPAAQAFAPEIQSIVLLSFQKDNVKFRDHIHRLSIAIYKHLILGTPLPNPEPYGIESWDGPIPKRRAIQGQAQKKAPAQRQLHQQPPSQNRRVPSQAQALPSAAPEKKVQQQQQTQVQQAQSPDALASMLDWSDNEDQLVPDDNLQPMDDTNMIELSIGGSGDDLYGSDNEDLPDAPPVRNGQQKSQNIFDDFGEVPKQENKQELEDDEKPRSPAAFAAFAKQNIENTGENESLLGGFDVPPAGHEELGGGLLLDDFAAPAPLPSSGSSQPKPQTSKDIFDVFGDPITDNSQMGWTKASLDGVDSPKPMQQLKDDDDFIFGNFTPKSSKESFGDIKPPSGDGAIATPSAPVQEDDNTFDPFANISQKPQTPTDNGNTFDPFSEKKEEIVDAFSGAPKAAENSPEKNRPSFDPFAGRPQQKKEQFDPFANMGTGSNNTFDPFANMTQNTKSNDGTFDPFGNMSQIQEKKEPTIQKQSSIETFDPFPTSKSTESNTADDTFDPFAKVGQKETPQTPQNNDDTFDPFAKVGQKQQQQKPQNPAQQQKSTQDDGETFDPFANMGQKQQQQKPVQKPQNPVQQQKPSQDDGEIFDPFANMGQKPQEKTQNPPQKQGSAIDLFDSLSQPSSKPSTPQISNTTSFDTFSDFSNPGSKKATPQSSQDIFDALSAPNTKPQTPAQQPKSSADAFDPFSGFGAQQQPQKQPRTTIKANSSQETFDPFAKSTPQQSTTKVPPKTASFEDLIPASTSSAKKTPSQSSASAFDVFSDFSNPSTPPRNSPKTSNDGVLDPFAQIGSAPSTKDQTFDAFSGFNSQQQKPQVKQGSSNVFDPFAGTQPQSKQSPNVSPQNSHDIFDVLGAPQTKQAVPPHQQGQKVNSRDIFDSLGGSQPQQKTSSNTQNLFDAFQPSQQQQKPTAKPQNMFDPFGGSTPKQNQSPQPQKPQQSSSDMFDPFAQLSSNNAGNQSKIQSSADVFDPFGGKPAAKPQQQSQIPLQRGSQLQSSGSSELFDPIGKPSNGTTTTTSGRFSISRTSNKPVTQSGDIFSINQQQKPAQQQKAPTSQPKNVFDFL